MKIKVFFHAILSKYEKSGIDIKISNHDMTSFDWGPVFMVKEMDIEIPSREDLINNTVTILRKKQADKRAECERDVIRLEHDIQSLLCIENSAAS